MLLKVDIEQMTLDQILERGKISLTHIPSAIGAAGHGVREQYPAWAATTWQPHYEKAEGNTPREAVNALLEKLDII